MKKSVFFLVFVASLFVQIAQAQYFTSNLKGAVLFANPIQSGYIEQEVDVQAAELKSTSAWEARTVKWGLILVGFGLLVSFMSFLGHIRTVLLAVAVIAVSALEIHFLWSTSGFTFYLPTVVGWGAAAKWFLCFTLFFLAQIYLFAKTLSLIDAEATKALGLTLIALIVVIIAFALAFLPAMFGASGIFTWLENNVLTIFIVAQVLIVASIFFNCNIKSAVLAAPFYAIGIAAIALMAVDLIIVAFLAAAALAIMPTMIQAATTRQEEYQDAPGGPIKTRWVDGVNPMDIFKKK